MPYLKCTEELCPLGFQTHISSGAWGSQRLLSCINTVYTCAFISSDPKLTTKTAVLNKCVVCVWFGGFLIQDFGHAFFCAMCTYSLNEIVFFLISMNRLLINLFIVVWRNTVLYFGVRRLFLCILAVCASALCVFASPYWGIRISYESADPRVIIALCHRTDFERNIYQI